MSSKTAPAAANSPQDAPPDGHAALQRMALRDLWQLSRQCTQRRQEAEVLLRDVTENAQHRFTLTHSRLGHRALRLREELDRRALREKQALDRRLTEEKRILEETRASRIAQCRDELDAAQNNVKKRQENTVWLAESVAEAAAQNAAREIRDCQRKAEDLQGQLRAASERMQKVIRRLGYRLLDPEDLPGDAAGAQTSEAPEQHFEQCVTRAGQVLEQLEHMGLAGWLRGIWPWVVVILLTVLAGSGGYLMYAAQALAGTAGPGAGFLIGLGAGIGLLLSMLVVGSIWAAAGRRLRACEREMHTLTQRANFWRERWLSEAMKQTEQRKEEARRKRAAELEEAKLKYEPMLAQVEQKAGERLRQAELSCTQEMQTWESQSRRSREELDAALSQAKTALEAKITRWTLLNREHQERTLGQAKQAYEKEMRSIQDVWEGGQSRIHQMIRETEDFAVAPWCAWTEAAWEKWSPPACFPPVVRFGQLEVDVKTIMGDLAHQGPYSLALPDKFTVPALLAFPDRASVLVEAGLDGRDASIAALQGMMTRILTALPAGRARFTLIDPVGLGRSFAGFMHLADHHELLVGPRIWTEADQIDQQLADLTSHMENVIQKYLRNEFATIDQYNAQAGELAEPYRFLVIVDFPTNFSDEAAHRVLAIMNSGARCGVYCLIATDPMRDLPGGATLEMLRARALNLVHQDGKFTWRDEVFENYPLLPDAPADEAFLTRTLHQVGAAALDANRVQVPFAAIAPPPGELWSRQCDQELVVPVGRTGATRQQTMRLGKGMAQHALIAGKTGSGKSTLLHVLVTNLALWYHPDQVEFYLIDFKKGVEFKTYATHHLPHARAVAIESDREFGLSVLHRLDEELKRRGVLFRAAGVQDLASYRRSPGAQPMPRVLLMVDEYQEFFTEDDKIAQDAGLLLDRLVRQGRAFGVHVILGSQTLSGSSGLSRSTIGQMSVRVALQCNEADSQLILSDTNTAARLLTRPGEAVYNDAGGMPEANDLFQVSWLNDDQRDAALDQVEEKVRAMGWRGQPTIVFEGNADADWTRNASLAQLLADGSRSQRRQAARLWLGEAVAIKEPTSLTLQRQSGANLLVIGQRDEAATALFIGAALTLAAQHPPGSARIIVLDGCTAGSPMEGKLAAALENLPLETQMVPWREVEPVIAQLAAELATRQTQEQGAMDAPAIYLFIYGLQRYRMLRKQEDAFSFSSEPAAPKPDQQFMDLLRDGPGVGIHTLVWIDTPASLERTIGRQSLREFDHRVLFQMSANDSSNLIDSPAANQLGFHRALYFSEEQGILEKFRPYALPPLDWTNQCKTQLQARTVT